MAILRFHVESAGHPLKNATIKVYTEDSAVAVGDEASGFTAGDLATIYSDRAMTTTINQTTSPITSDSQGDVTTYAASGSLFAVSATRAGFGTKWHRDVEVLTSDPL